MYFVQLKCEITENDILITEKSIQSLYSYNHPYKHKTLHVGL